MATLTRTQRLNISTVSNIGVMDGVGALGRLIHVNVSLIPHLLFAYSAALFFWRQLLVS